MLSLAAGFFLRSAAILGIFLLLRQSLRRCPPGIRHRLLLLAFVLLALQPLLYLCSPLLVLSFATRGANVATQQSFRTIATAAQAAPPNFLQLYWPVLLYAAGVCGAAASLLQSWRKVMLLRRRAVLANNEWGSLVRSLCDEHGIARLPEIAVSPEEIIPFACGLRRTSIVLPSSCHAWPGHRRRAVLLHELAHLQRRDIAAQLFASVVLTFWWLQPLAWFAYRELRRECEAASDAFVLRAGVRASDYASDLLAIAQEFGCQSQLPVQAIGMARGHGLAARVRDVLSAQQPRNISHSLLLALVATLTALAMTVSAVTFDAQQNSKGGITMKRAIIAGLFAGTGIAAAASVSGTLYDERGAALGNVQVSISNSDTSVSQESTTDSHGKFSFPLPEGEYILRVQRPGFATLLREFKLQNATDVDRGLTLQMNSNQNPPQEPNNPQPVRVPGTLEQSNLIHKVQPQYPVAAKAAHVQGVVKLEATISKEGVPQDIRVTSSPDDDLSQSALEAVRQWRYQPVLLNGKPVDVVTEVIVTYTLAP